MSRKVVASKRVGLDLTGKLVTIQSHKIRSQILWPISAATGNFTNPIEVQGPKKWSGLTTKNGKRMCSNSSKRNAIKSIVWVSLLQIVRGGRRGGRECKIANLQMESLRILPQLCPAAVLPVSNGNSHRPQMQHDQGRFFWNSRFNFPTLKSQCLLPNICFLKWK